MRNAIANWEDITWGEISREVFRRQRRIFDAAKHDDKQTLHAEQLRLLGSFNARLLAVRQVAARSKGKKTAGPDGKASLTGDEMLALASALSISHRPNPVRRVLIPKPGKKEMRPLGIPDMADRAHQALLSLAIEPEWEARLTDHMYGFRKGRNPSDAAQSIRRFLGKTPCYVLDADVEKFFDRLNHDELIRKLDLPKAVSTAVERVLKSGVLTDGELMPTELGTPQGGPLSPILANVAMTGLERGLMDAFRIHFKGQATRLGRPRVVIWADDLVVLHRDQRVVEWSRKYIENFLSTWGLNLSESKTSIRHTQMATGDTGPGFDFLGFHFQHVWHNRKKPGGGRSSYVLITPSKKSVQRFLDEFKDILKGRVLSRKHRAARQHRQLRGRTDPVSKMIARLNRKIRGWANYFRFVNSKRAFSKLDHEIHNALWSWTAKRFPQKAVAWKKERLFSGRPHDRLGIHARRQDGSRRKIEWVFKSPFVTNAGEHETLNRMAHVAIPRRVAVVASKSYFDGDWAYWATRDTTYPVTPVGILRAAFKRQRGKCSVCSAPLLAGQSFLQMKSGPERGIRHSECKSSTAPARPRRKTKLKGDPV